MFWLIFILLLSLFASAFALAFRRFTRNHCLQILGLKMRSATWNRLLLEKLLMDSNPSPLCRLVTWIQIRARINHRKNKKADSGRLFTRKLTANLELLMITRIKRTRLEGRLIDEKVIFRRMSSLHCKTFFVLHTWGARRFTKLASQNISEARCLYCTKQPSPVC